MEIRFYHLSRTPITKALPQILDKAYERKLLTYIYCADKPFLQGLSKSIWSHKAEGFIPHGSLDETHREHQPILLGCAIPTETAENKAKLLVTTTANGLFDADYQFPYSQWFHFFDGNDAKSLEDARTMWKSLAKAHGHELTYWQQSETGWTKK